MLCAFILISEMSFIICVLSPSSGPQVLSFTNVPTEIANWLAKRFVSDHGLPEWKSGKIESFLDFKFTVITQLEVVCATVTFREVGYDSCADHLIPTYCFCFVTHIKHRARFAVLTFAIKDRLQSLAREALEALEQSDGDVVDVADTNVQQTWVELCENFSRTYELWMHAFVKRGDADSWLENNETMLFDLSNAGSGFVQRFTVVLSTVLSNRHTIIRGSDTNTVDKWVRTALVFCSDEQLLISSGNCSCNIDDVLPSLFLQGTTCSWSDTLAAKLQVSRFPFAFIDIDKPIHEAYHIDTPSFSHSASEWESWKPTSLSFLEKCVPSVVEALKQLECLICTFVKEPTRNTSFSSATSGVLDLHSWRTLARNFLQPFVARWRVKQMLLATRMLFADQFPCSLLPSVEGAQADMFFSLTFSPVSLRIERNAIEFVSRIDQF